MYNKQRRINKYLHIIFKTKESSKPEFGKRGFDPSHFKIVPSSSGNGRNVKTDVTFEPLAFVELVICEIEKKKITSIKNYIQ